MIGEFAPRPEAVLNMLHPQSHIQTAIVAQPNVVRAFEASTGARMTTQCATDVILSRPNANDEQFRAGRESR
jgi:hypothetical protein